MYALTRGHEKAPSSRDDAPTPDAFGHHAENASNPSLRRVPKFTSREQTMRPQVHVA